MDSRKASTFCRYSKLSEMQELEFMMARKQMQELGLQLRNESL